MKRVSKAIFPVAGLGTRFLPATKSIPKEIMTLVDRPLIQYAIDEARAAGIKEFIFVTARGKSALEDYFDIAPELENTLRKKGKTELLKTLKSTNMDSGEIAYMRQNKALGLGHAVWCARRLLGNEPFAVILPDDVIAAEKPCLQQMVEAHAEIGGNMVAAMEVPPEMASSYGMLDIKEDMGSVVSVKGMVEKPAVADAPSNLRVTGRYVFTAEIFDRLARTQPGRGGEIQLTDAMAMLIGDPGLRGLVIDDIGFDAGQKADWLRANVELALREDADGSTAAMLRAALGD